MKSIVCLDVSIEYCLIFFFLLYYFFLRKIFPLNAKYFFKWLNGRTVKLLIKCSLLFLSLFT